MRSPNDIRRTNFDIFWRESPLKCSSSHRVKIWGDKTMIWESLALASRELVVPRLMIMWCHPLVKPTAVKWTTKSPLLDVISQISASWTKCIHLVSNKFRKIYFVASNGRDGNWNSEDYITIFWRGSEGVVKTGLLEFRSLSAKRCCLKVRNIE